MIPGKKYGNYIIDKELGKGSYGEVGRAYMEQQDGTKQYYAIKQIAKERLLKSLKLQELFASELSIMKRLNHKNLLHCYENLQTSNNYYLILNYCNNGDLKSYLINNGSLPEDEAVHFLKQIMNGFKVLVEHKIMHRDIKLANLFLNDNTVVIGDFGFAKEHVSQTDTNLGTPYTKAPEIQFKENPGDKYTNKADLWSIGVCFYEMLYNVIPWDPMGKLYYFKQ